ncbi:MAG TPA: hypothetical protein VFO55_14935 [Gemmatimonadaceae bacterium]|nr:hypothetical protein [Gemmatimonadaceae bacterium]
MTTAPLPLAPRADGEPYELPVSGSLVVARWSTVIAGVALLASALLGLLYGEQWLYQSDALLLPQVYGQDVISLVIALPLLGLAVWRARRGSARGLVVWAGALIYIAYWYHFHLGAIPFGPLFLLHVALVASSLLALGVLVARSDVGRFAHRFRAAMPARTIGGMMIILGAVFSTVWIADVVERLGHGEVLDPAARGVYAVDLTVMLPVTIVAGFLLWRHHPWGYALSGPLLVNALLSMLTLWATSLLTSAAGMAVAGLQILSFSIATLVMIVCVLLYMRELRV